MQVMLFLVSRMYLPKQNGNILFFSTHYIICPGCKIVYMRFYTGCAVSQILVAIVDVIFQSSVVE